MQSAIRRKTFWQKMSVRLLMLSCLVMFITQAVGIAMILKRRGKIIHIGSITGKLVRQLITNICKYDCRLYGNFFIIREISARKI